MTTPSSKATLSTLLPKLQSATGPDRELDAEIAVALRLHPAGAFRMYGLGDGGMFGVGAYKQWFAPPLTASVDAVLSLVGERLPGRFWAVSSPDSLRDVGHYQAEIAEGSMAFDCFTATAPTPALALLSALLSALAAGADPSNTQEQS
jgi:hypothetical protein